MSSRLRSALVVVGLDAALWALVVGAVVVVASCSSSDKRIRAVPAGFVDPAVRDSVLARAWTDVVGVKESGGPVTSWHRNTPDTIIVTSIAFDPGAPSTATSFHGLYGSEPSWHTHHFQTCNTAGTGCKRGGWLASYCAPSADDRASLKEQGAPFGIIQCGPHQLVFYFPEAR